MKENKGKEVMDEANRPKTQSQLRPSTGDKRKSLSKMLDLGNLPNRREKKAKHDKDDVVAEFKASKQYTNLLDENYATGFVNFHIDAEERFPKVGFSSIKLNIGAVSSLFQTSSKDVNIEGEATTLPTQDNPTSRDNPQ